LLKLRDDDPLREEKCNRWLRDGYLPSRRVRISIGDVDASKLLMAMLRIISVDRDDFLFIRVHFPGTYTSIRELHFPLNIKNELRSLELLRDICADYLGRYKRTLDEDIALLAGSELPPFSNRRNACIQVKGEKVVLHHLMELAECGISLLQAPSRTAADVKLVEISQTKHSNIYEYCRTYLQRLKIHEENKRDMKDTKADLSKPTIL
jgi:hypothetical protein